MGTSYRSRGPEQGEDEDRCDGLDEVAAGPRGAAGIAERTDRCSLGDPQRADSLTLGERFGIWQAEQAENPYRRSPRLV
jgi:hypothetical protein